jgi:hypothetical protein
MKLHDEIEMLNERIVQDQRRIEQSKKEKIDIQNLNFVLDEPKTIETYFRTSET